MMKKNFVRLSKTTLKNKKFQFGAVVTTIALLVFFLIPELLSVEVSYEKEKSKGESFTDSIKNLISPPKVPLLDVEAYDKKMNELANNPPPAPPTTNGDTGEVIPPPLVKHLWPVETVYPKDGAILPFKRIIAYYGNLYSKKMGALGEYEEDEMLRRLNVEVKKWDMADPSTPAVPALHYIAVVAQATAGADGKYRARMPDSEIEKVLKMAEKINAIVFLDIQVGFSNLQTEVPFFEKYLKMPNVHLGIDAEFSMKSGIRPGKVVGTLDAEDINFTTNYLAKLVKENDLVPKVLVIHRYTQKMITNYQNINTPREVQIVMHMDGWGGKAMKKNTYQQFVYKEPVQFAGFKIFYKHDVKQPGTVLFEPSELLLLRPIPSYIQYQ